MRQGYSKARRTYDQDVSETAAAILAKALATRPGPQLRTFPASGLTTTAPARTALRSDPDHLDARHRVVVAILHLLTDR